MTDLIATVSRLLTPDVIGKMASAAGTNSATAEKAASAAIPAILGGLTSLVSKPGGARQLADTVAEQPLGSLSSIVSALGGNAQLQEQGSSAITGLLGSGMLGSLASAIGRFAGLGEGSARSLIGLLAPVVLGVLGREQRATGMDAGGLARMLIDQKDQIASAMPAAFSSMFNPQQAFESSMRASTASAPRAQVPEDVEAFPGSRRAAAGGTPPPQARSASSSNWAYWVLPLLALAGLVWYLLPHADTSGRVATQTEPVRPEAAQVVPKASDKSVYLRLPGQGWTSAKVYINQEIQNRDGEKLGIVKDLLVGPDGKVNAVVIGVGRFLGMGEKDIAVPLAVLQVNGRDGNSVIMMDVAREFLRQAPSYEPAAGR